MKKTRILFSLLLILTLTLSVALTSCFGGTGGGGGNGGEIIPAEKYAVTFVNGAEDATGEAPASLEIEEGADLTLPANPFTREGYKFTGWRYGANVYTAGATFKMPAVDVTFTAVWEEVIVDVPTLSELDGKFYDASNWEYMTNNNGASNDGGNIPYSMADGSIKFHNANQAILMGDQTNGTYSFMLKATNDFSIWFNSSTKDNANNSSYRLNYAYGELRIALSSAPEQSAAVVGGDLYKKGEWNRFDIVFSTTDGVCEIKLYVNGERAPLAAGNNTTPHIKVENNVLTHTQPAMFSTGEYMVVKVWEAHNFVQLKPVAKADEKDLPIIACIGASITEGAGAGHFYNESYPAQLQNALGGLYNVVNFGNSGKTVRTDLGDDVAWLKQNQFKGVQAIVPDIAILNIGTNDSKTSNDPLSTYESFNEAYEYLIDQLLAINPDMQIIICTVPYAYSDIWGINNDNIANIIAPVQRDLAEARGFELIDLYEYSQGKSHLFPDGVHPNTKGYEMFVKIIKKALLEGDEALTEEFIASINEEYGAKVPNAYATVDSVVIDNMTLTITGKTNDEGLKLYVGQEPTDDTVYNSYTDLVFGEEEAFSVSFDLKTMPIGGWYNVRLYFTDGNYHTISLNDAKNGSGEALALWSWVILENTQVQICSWNEGEIPTLSFKVEEYVKPSFEATITGGSIEEKDGQILLTVTGTTNDTSLILLVGVSDDPSIYGHEVTVADGNFTATLDLSSLEAGLGWYNVRIVMSDGNMIPVPYNKLGVNVEDTFYSANKKVVIKNWSAGDKLTSLLVENYDSSYTLTATEVKFENGKLVFSGTTTNVRTLTAYLYNTAEAIMDYKADAVLAEDGSFTVEIALDQLTMAAGNWYYLWTSVNGGDLTKVVYQDYDASEYYGYGYRTYKWEYWEGIAVNYSNFEYSLTETSITEVDGKATLTIAGLMKDSTIAADTITLKLDKTKGTKEVIDLENLETEAGKFRFVYDISGLINSAVTTQYSEEAYFIRLYVGGAKKADVNSRWMANELFEKIEIGEGVYYFMKNGASSWNTLGLVRLDAEVETFDYFLQGGQVSMSNMPFSLTAEGETAYLKFDGLFGASNKVERTIELILTTEDPSDTPASLDASMIVYTAANKYEGDSNQAFSFKIDVKEIGKQSGWMRFVLKVTEGDKVAYYTIKPSVPAHTGDWNAIGESVTIDGIKYELAICWSSLFIQTP